MSDCIFCKLAGGEIPTEVLYQDDEIFAFLDNAPQAPVHFLVIPKKHIESLDAASEEDAKLLGHMLLKVREIAKAQGLENGYRVNINTGNDGGQTVKHLHMHVLGKKQMGWPPFPNID